MEGTVYYTDIIDSLRDEFIENNNQTPHFVYQGTGREYFVENARSLDALRAKFIGMLTVEEPIVSISVIEPELTTLAILEQAERKYAKKDRAQAFISDLFARISAELSHDDISSTF